MNYMLLVYRSEVPTDEPDPNAELGNHGCNGLAERLHNSGHYKSGGILQPTATATSIRVRGGKPLITDGPFAETREQLAGYMMIEAADLDEAISIAAMHPVAQIGTVEIRPLQEIPAFTTKVAN